MRKGKDMQCVMRIKSQGEFGVNNIPGMHGLLKEIALVNFDRMKSSVMVIAEHRRQAKLCAFYVRAHQLAQAALRQQATGCHDEFLSSADHDAATSEVKAKLARHFNAVQESSSWLEREQAARETDLNLPHRMVASGFFVDE